VSEARRALRRARYDALDTAIGNSRSARFVRRANRQAEPSFTDMAMVPDWLMLPPLRQDRVARLAGLVQHRAAIDHELSGPRLAMLAAAVGEDLFDAACAADLAVAPANLAALPRPDVLIADGWATLRAGLPPVFAAAHDGACGDGDARALTEAAMHIEQAMPVIAPATETAS
jgi:hypothetical protein